MKGIVTVLRALDTGERELAQGLDTAAERHRAEHEIHHVATDLARWSREHAQCLAYYAHARGLDLTVPSDALYVLSPLRQHTAETGGHRPEAGLLLLRDLRELHLRATENSLSWEALAQAAQATTDTELLELTSACHPRTLRQMRWTNTMIKNLSPQILTSL
ncbi:hypothetical protein ACQEVG_37610 [Streptomyces sp. CA-135486]|uniref:hypothetical protein n=1 Tax=Streptomyces sp. CA-135486 TaxID=3240049 RepID=UPI003D8D0FEC